MNGKTNYLFFFTRFLWPSTTTNPAAAADTRAPHPSPQEPHVPVHNEPAEPVRDVPTVKPAAPIPVEMVLIFFFVYEMAFFITLDPPYTEVFSFKEVDGTVLLCQPRSPVPKVIAFVGHDDVHWRQVIQL